MFEAEECRDLDERIKLHYQLAENFFEKAEAALESCDIGEAGIYALYAWAHYRHAEVGNKDFSDLSMAERYVNNYFIGYYDFGRELDRANLFVSTLLSRQRLDEFYSVRNYAQVVDKF